MFGLFKKVHDSSMMFADDNWQVAQGEYDGSLIVVRINANLRSFVGKSGVTTEFGKNSTLSYSSYFSFVNLMHASGGCIHG